MNRLYLLIVFATINLHHVYGRSYGFLRERSSLYDKQQDETSFAERLMNSLPTRHLASAETNSNFIDSCQPDGELCFNAGGSDVFCCSGKCGSNRRCASGGINSNDIEIVISNSAYPTNKPTRKPKQQQSNPPTNKPVTEKPTLKPSFKPQSDEQETLPFTSKSSNNGCESGEVKVTIEIKTGMLISLTPCYIYIV